MFKYPEHLRIQLAPPWPQSKPGENGAFGLKTSDGYVRIIAAKGDGWEHVSVSHANKCPSWATMCQIKDLFFDPEDCVFQLHPPRSEWISVHPYCLHLWKPEEGEIPRPPSWMVG